MKLNFEIWKSSLRLFQIRNFLEKERKDYGLAGEEDFLSRLGENFLIQNLTTEVPQGKKIRKTSKLKVREGFQNLGKRWNPFEDFVVSKKDSIRGRVKGDESNLFVKKDAVYGNGLPADGEACELHREKRNPV